MSDQLHQLHTSNEILYMQVLDKGTLKSIYLEETRKPWKTSIWIAGPHKIQSSYHLNTAARRWCTTTLCSMYLIAR